MVHTTMETRSAGAQSGARQPSSAATLPAFDTEAVFSEIGGSIDSVRDEINEAFGAMKTFRDREPDEVMRLIGGHSARLSELRVRIQRIEDFHRQWRGIRTREIEPTLEELSKQFQVASRLLTVRELDWRIETGQR
jgi:hypothetical protein